MIRCTLFCATTVLKSRLLVRALGLLTLIALLFGLTSQHSIGQSVQDLSGDRLKITKNELQILGEHISKRLNAQYTADGKWIVASGADGTTLHNEDASRCLGWFNGQLIAVSPTDNTFLLRCPNGVPQLRSIPDGRLIWQLPLEIKSKPLYFSDDGKYLAHGFSKLLDVVKQKIVFRMPSSYHYSPIGGDQYRDASQRPKDDAKPNDAQDKRRLLPFICRNQVRSDGKILVLPSSGLFSPNKTFSILGVREDDQYNTQHTHFKRQTGQRIFSDLPKGAVSYSSDDQFALVDNSVYRTSDATFCFELEQQVSSHAFCKVGQTIAVGYKNGIVEVLDLETGKRRLKLQVEEFSDERRNIRGEIVALAFSNEGDRLAVVGRHLSIVDIQSKKLIDSIDLDTPSKEVGKPLVTSPAQIAFNANDSRLLLSIDQTFEYLYTRKKVLVVDPRDLRSQQSLTSSTIFSRLGLEPLLFDSSGTWAIVSQHHSSHKTPFLIKNFQFWNTKTNQLIAEKKATRFQRHFRQRFVVPDFPKRHCRSGPGKYDNWHPTEIVLFPWSIETLQKESGTALAPDAIAWLSTMVRASASNRFRSNKGKTLDLVDRQWRLAFENNRIDRLYDLSNGKTYPPDYRELTHEEKHKLSQQKKPESCWGLASVSGSAFSADGTLLLVHWRICTRTKTSSQMALFEMPSGKLVRTYENHERIENINFSPNNRLAAISHPFFQKTKIIDLESGEVLLKSLEKGRCTFSPDSRFLHVGNRYGESREIFEIPTGRSIDIARTQRWAFSPTSEFAVVIDHNEAAFVNLETGERKLVSGDAQESGLETLSTTRLQLPFSGSRLVSEESDRNTGSTITNLYDVDSAQRITKFDWKEHARKNVDVKNGNMEFNASKYLYTPDDQLFVKVIRGIVDSKNPEQREYSTQVLVGDFETGKQIKCSKPVWCTSQIQHKLFSPNAKNLITISADKVVCWDLQSAKPAWQKSLIGQWLNPETGAPFTGEEVAPLTMNCLTHPDDTSILVSAVGYQAILLDLKTGQKKQTFHDIPADAVLRFGSDGKFLQVSFRSHRSMRSYDAATGKLLTSFHFTERHPDGTDPDPDPNWHLFHNAEN